MFWPRVILFAKYLRGVVVDEIINGYELDPSTNKLINKNFHHDQVNSVTEITDHTGGNVETFDYSPFGRGGFQTSSGLASTGNMRYTGRALDSETGLYYYRARYYDPQLGRFLSEDPLGFQAGVNFYAYVNNNPLRFNDPMGQEIQISLNTVYTGFLGIWFGPGVGGSVSYGGGISLPESFSDWRNVQLFITAQESVFGGFGGYIGAETEIGIGRTEGVLTTGLDMLGSAHFVTNFGTGRSSYGLSADYSVPGDHSIDNIAGIDSLIGLNIRPSGIGLGFMAAGGPSGTQTIASPTLGDGINYISESYNNFVTGVNDFFFGNNTSYDSSGISLELFPSGTNLNTLSGVYYKP